MPEEDRVYESNHGRYLVFDPDCHRPGRRIALHGVSGVNNGPPGQEWGRANIQKRDHGSVPKRILNPARDHREAQRHRQEGERTLMVNRG